MIERHVVELSARDNLTPILKRAGQTAEDTGRRGKRSAEDWGRAFTAVGVGAGSALAVISKLGAAHLTEERQIKAVERAYGDSSDTILDFTQKIQDAGIASDDTARIAALGAQSLAKNYGLTADQITQLIARSADLSAVTFDQYGNQLGLADVMQRVQSAIRGEAESAEVLGVAMSDTRLAALAAAEGMTGWNSTMTDAEKAAFRLKVFMQDTASAQGAAAEQADTAAGKINALKIQMGDLASEAGGAVGPLGDLTAGLADVALAAPLAGGAIGKLLGGAGKAGTLFVGAEGATALGAGLTSVGVAAAALAVPLGIATYLFIDQENVVSKATETTLKNQQVLEGYINYLKGIDVSDTAITQMSQDMKELLDWATKSAAANMFETLVDPDAAGPIQAYTVSLHELDDTIRNLSPENLQFVLQAAEDLGLKFNDPSTWNDQNVGALMEMIVQLSRAEADASYEAVELSRTQGGLNAIMSTTATATDKARQAMYGYSQEAASSVPVLDSASVAAHDTERAFQDWGDSLIEHRHTITDVTAAIDAQNEKQAEMADSFDAVDRTVTQATRDFSDLTGWMGETTDASAALSEQLDNLSDAFGSMTAADVLESTFGAIVGYTNDIVGSIDKVKEWSDALMAPLGTDFMDDGAMSKMLDLLQRGKIDTEDYNEALDAQRRIYGDLARAQDAQAVIQIKQSNFIADATDATADYLENISKLPEAEQATALAWADSDISGRAQDIADMAANWDDMSKAQRDAFEATTLSAAKLDPMLANLLFKMGVLKGDINDPSSWTLSLDTSKAQDPLDKLTESINNLVTALEITYKIDINGDGVIGVNEHIKEAQRNLDGLDDNTPVVTVDDESVLTAHGDITDAHNALNGDGGLDGQLARVTVDADTGAFWQAIANIPQLVGDRYINVHGVGFTMATGGVVGAGHLHAIDTAALGRVSGGNLTLVGENGPELVNLPGGSFVTPNHAAQFRPEMKGGGGVVINELHIHGVQNPRQFMDWQRQYSSAMERS